VKRSGRLEWEVYNNGLDFEHSIELAWNRLQYETAFGENLQHPKARVVDLKPFSFDRITFEMEYLGTRAERNDAAAARGATLCVWKRIDSRLSDHPYWDALDNPTKTALDESIIPIVQKEIIVPFCPYRSAADCDRPYRSAADCDLP
jgi:hypothetical protein